MINLENVENKLC